MRQEESSPEPSERAGSCQHPELAFLASKIVRQCICCFKSPALVCANASQQP